MNKLVFLLIALFFAGFVSAQHTPWRKGEMEVKIIFHNSSDATSLASLSLNADIYRDYAWAYVVPSELEEIKKAGFEVVVEKSDLNAWSAGFGSALVPDGYYTFDQIRQIADSLAANFPSICRKVIYGYNAGMQELAALKISDSVMIDEAEPEILFDGGIHGDEVGGPQNVIQFARDLCLAYGSDPQITNLVNSREIWLYYCVNPFGRDLMTRYNSNGVDLNRDGGYMWGGVSNSPDPFSQPESKALRDCQYSNQFVSYTNYHSGSETISYPWSYRYSPVPDEPSIDHLAQIYSQHSGYPYLPFGQGSEIMYLIQGSTKDFNYGSLGSVAWTIEISLDKQTPSVQYYYSINKPAMLTLIEHAGYGIQGMITDSYTGKPVNAAIFTGNNYPVYSDGQVGDYHKYLMAGTYTLKIVANGYETLTIPNVVVNNLSCTTVNAQLKPVASQYAYRVVSCYIPAFNAQNPGDEGYTAACLGSPDHLNYSIGRGGNIVLDMQDTIFDGASGTNDVTVYEGDSSPEGYTLYAGQSMDGPWFSLGNKLGTASFNFQTAGISWARFLKVVDDNDGTSNVNDAGFDLDAIACMHPAKPDTVGYLSGHVYDVFTNLGLKGAAVSWNGNTVLTDSTGKYDIQLNRGTDEVCASMEGYRPECDTFNVQPQHSYLKDFYLFSTDGYPEISLFTPKLVASPNPFRTDFDISFTLNKPGTCTFDLFDSYGRALLSAKKRCYSTGSHNLKVESVFHDISNLESGAYILIVHTPEGVYFEKLIKAL